MRFRFGGFLLDDESFRLTRSGQPVALRRKVFDLLVALVRARERVVLRDELVERLWSTTAVGAGSLSGLVNELRGALGEGGRGGSSIRTVHARGYQFVAPVELELADGANDASGVPAPVVEGRIGAQARGGEHDRLARACWAVRRSGARALVAAVADPVARASWLAGMLVDAGEAGFETRWEVLEAERLDRGLAGGIASESGGCAAFGGADRGSASAQAARPAIALGLEVHEPGAWARAGGLSRLLDLLGRAPVLVIAGLAVGRDEDRVPVLLGRDARIELAGAGAVDEAWAPSSEAGKGLAGATGDRLAGILRALARPDEAAFAAALRTLGFELARLEPIRSVRRVDPAARAPELRRSMERI